MFLLGINVFNIKKEISEVYTIDFSQNHKDLSLFLGFFNYNIGDKKKKKEQNNMIREIRIKRPNNPDGIDLVLSVMGSSDFEIPEILEKIRNAQFWDKDTLLIDMRHVIERELYLKETK